MGDRLPPHGLDLPGKADARQDRYIPDLQRDPAHAAGWEPHNLHDLACLFPGLDLCYTGLAQHPTSAG